MKNKNITISQINNTTELKLPFVDNLRAGFPSPAEDYIDLKIDLNKELITNPNSTFFGRVKGNSMTGADINEGDVLIIDKSIEPYSNAVAVCFIDGEFTVKKLKIENNCCYLMPANDDFEPIKINPENNFIIWGIVTYIIKKIG